jgi:uncharacterized protein with PIN domain
MPEPTDAATHPDGAGRPRFLCDAMLHGLARWLRASGHDAEVAGRGEDDRDVAARALAGGRILVTRDRGLLDRREARGGAVAISADRVPDQARELAARLGAAGVALDWLADPFSRCTLCNATLAPAPPERRGEAPASVRRRGLPVLECPGCARLYYWAGSHHERMRRTLEGFAAPA